MVSEEAEVHVVNFKECVNNMCNILEFFKCWH